MIQAKEKQASNIELVHHLFFDVRVCVCVCSTHRFLASFLLFLRLLAWVGFSSPKSIDPHRFGPLDECIASLLMFTWPSELGLSVSASSSATEGQAVSSSSSSSRERDDPPSRERFKSPRPPSPVHPIDFWPETLASCESDCSGGAQADQTHSGCDCGSRFGGFQTTRHPCQIIVHEGPRCC